MEQVALSQLSSGLSNETLLGVVIGLWLSWSVIRKVWLHLIPKGKENLEDLYKMQKENLKINKECSDNINKVVTILEIVCPIIERQSENVAIIKSHIKEK